MVFKSYELGLAFDQKGVRYKKLQKCHKFLQKTKQDFSMRNICFNIETYFIVSKYMF